MSISGVPGPSIPHWTCLISNSTARAEVEGVVWPVKGSSVSLLPLCRLSLSDIKYWLRRFAAIDSDCDGFVSADDLLHYLAVPNDACTQAVFTALSKVCYVII